MSQNRRGTVTSPLGLVALAAVLMLTPAACSADDPEIATPIPPADDEGALTDTGPDDTSAPLADDGTELVAQGRERTVEVWSSPTESRSPDRTLDGAEEMSGEVVMLVKQELGERWIEVWLPGTPVGRSGWVRRDAVAVSQHRFRIEVDRSAHELALFAGDVEVLRTPVTIGPDAPTGDDGLYVKDLVETPDPDGRYGRYAYGLTGSSNTVERFDGTAGVVAIHGTDTPGALGTDGDTGSLAIAPDALERMVTSIGLPLGTPVRLLD